MGQSSGFKNLNITSKQQLGLFNMCNWH